MISWDDDDVAALDRDCLVVATTGVIEEMEFAGGLTGHDQLDDDLAPVELEMARFQEPGRHEHERHDRIAGMPQRCAALVRARAQARRELVEVAPLEPREQLSVEQGADEIHLSSMSHLSVRAECSDSDGR